MNKLEYLIIHTEAAPLVTNAPRFDVVNNYHRQLFNFKSSLGFWCGYQYFVEKSGKVIQARADTEEGAHTKGYNSVSIGICLAGNGDVELPTQTQIDALSELLARKSKEWNIPKEKIVPHRFFLTHKEKTCYGRLLSNEWARNLVVPVVPTAPIWPNIEEQLSAIQKMIQWIREQIALLSAKKVGGKNRDHIV